MPIQPKIDPSTSCKGDIREISRLVRERNGINMGEGINALSTPADLIQYAHIAMQRHQNTYGPSQGVLLLRQQIAQNEQVQHGITIDPNSSVLITSGATGAFCSAFFHLLRAGNEALFLEPFYPYHVASARLCGAIPRFVRLQPPDWRLDIDAIRAAMTTRTRLFVLCNPSNPSGRVYSRQELEQLLALCIQKNVMIIVDEIYADFIFDGHIHTPIRSIPGSESHSITVSSFSKNYATTGWRVGYALGPEKDIQAMTGIHDTLYTCAPTPFQWAMVEGLKQHSAYTQTLRIDFLRRRQLIQETLTNVGFTIIPAQGTFFLVAGYKNLYGDISSYEASIRILEQTNIAMLPFSSFYDDTYDPQLLRICYALPDADLKQAIQRLQTLLS